MSLTPSDLWPHQARALADVASAIALGERRICLTIPTGGGKTLVACRLIEEWTRQGLSTVLYTNRRLLVEQTSRVLGLQGIGHGVRAAGYEDEREFAVQVSSLQTEHSRVLQGQTWHLHAADRVLVDECHSQRGDVAGTILRAHHGQGAVVLGLTATPLGLEGLYTCLIQGGNTSELRRCGALVPCLHYGPDEPDLRHIGKQAVGQDLTEAQNVKAIMVEGIFGRVLEWFEILNPERKPTILFAPGVAESVWFAEQFTEAGVTAAHIDGQEVWVDGQLERSSRQARADVLGRSRDGKITVVCNRFVLREGVDAPWLAHGIFATVFGSLQTYLQSGGRILRAHPGIVAVTLQDHGGNWHRHGSLNADRSWALGDTSEKLTGEWQEGLRKKTLPEPMRCARCARILFGARCPCGFVLDLRRKSRPVIQADGTPVEYRGDIYKPRLVNTRPDAEKKWTAMYFRAKHSGMTFKQAAGLYARENKSWPSKDWAFMPTSENDWCRKVGEVPRERLT